MGKAMEKLSARLLVVAAVAEGTDPVRAKRVDVGWWLTATSADISIFKIS